MASFPTNELNHLSTTYNTKVGNRWDGRETARRQQELGLGLDLESDLELGLRLDLRLGFRLGLGLGFRLGFRLGFGLGFRLGFPLDIGEWQVFQGEQAP